MGLFDFWKLRKSSTHSWVIHKRIYEKFPLYLRLCKSSETTQNRAAFTTLAILTHQFTYRQPNGLPESRYNDGLAKFDSILLSAFDEPFAGVPILVETFGGKRTYYYYIDENVDVSLIVAKVAKSFPLENLTGKMSTDKNWSFLSRYSAEFCLDENGDILAEMQMHGDNFEIARDINFSFLFETEAQATNFTNQIKSADLRADVSRHKKGWEVEVTRHMLPQHKSINDLEARLIQVATDHGGKPDGWGCFAQKHDVAS